MLRYSFILLLALTGLSAKIAAQDDTVWNDSTLAKTNYARAAAAASPYRITITRSSCYFQDSISLTITRRSGASYYQLVYYREPHYSKKHTAHKSGRLNTEQEAILVTLEEKIQERVAAYKAWPDSMRVAADCRDMVVYTIKGKGHDKIFTDWNCKIGAAGIDAIANLFKL